MRYGGVDVGPFFKEFWAKYIEAQNKQSANQAAKEQQQLAKIASKGPLIVEVLERRVNGRRREYLVRR